MKNMYTAIVVVCAALITACAPPTKEEVNNTIEENAIKSLPVGTTILSIDANRWITFNIKSSCYLGKDIGFTGHNPGLVLPIECP